MLDEIATFMADDDNDKLLSRKERAAWYKQITIGAAGFFLATALAVINAFSATRGSVMVVQPPVQLIVYRDGKDDKAVLTFAMRVAMINAADSQQGDVLMDARITPVGAGPVFSYTGTMKPVFTDKADTAECELGARCIAQKGFLAIETTDEIIDIPGGTVRGPYLFYPIVEWNCLGAKDKPVATCPQFATFDTAVDTLGSKPLSVMVEIDFFRDGKRQMLCSSRALDAAYLRDRGWMAMSCDTATVTGAPWF